MSWIAEKATIPVPDVVVYNHSVNNIIAYEYTLLSRVKGKTLSKIYQTLDN